jgi:methionyl-tRNA synthetase
LLVHGWWNLGGAKMSKSAGNIVDPVVLAEKYGVDALRYYLMSDIITGEDADFSEDTLLVRYNTELANSIGNLLNRVLSMVHAYLDGKLTTVTNVPQQVKDSFRNATREYARFMNAHAVGGRLRIRSDDVKGQIAQGVDTNLAAIGEMQSRDVQRSLGAVGIFQSLATFGNRVSERTAPWQLAKDPSLRADVARVLSVLAECLRIIAILISPVLPKAAHGIFDQLNWKMELSGKEERFSLADAEWGRLPNGHVVGKPVPLFPRIEVDEGV